MSSQTYLTVVLASTGEPLSTQVEPDGEVNLAPPGEGNGGPWKARDVDQVDRVLRKPVPSYLRSCSRPGWGTLRRDEMSVARVTVTSEPVDLEAERSPSVRATSARRVPASVAKLWMPDLGPFLTDRMYHLAVGYLEDTRDPVSTVGGRVLTSDRDHPDSRIVLAAVPPREEFAADDEDGRPCVAFVCLDDANPDLRPELDVERLRAISEAAWEGLRTDGPGPR